LSYLVHTHTDKQTKTGKNITSLAEVIMKDNKYHYNIISRAGSIQRGPAANNEVGPSFCTTKIIKLLQVHVQKVLVVNVKRNVKSNSAYC